MPSTYAHRCFGRQVLAALPQEMQQLLRPEQALFSTAPIFCFLIIRCSGTSAASATGCTNKAARPSSVPQGRSWPHWSFRRRKRRISMDFCATLRWTAPATATLPSEFDRSLLVQAGLDPIRTSLTGHLHASARSAAVMAELLPDGLTPRQTERAIRTFLRGNALFLAPGHCKRTVLYTGMRLAGAYHGLHGMIVNYEPNPKCAESNLVLQRLFDEAVPQAVTLITEYLPCIRGELPWSGLYDYTFGGVFT